MREIVRGGLDLALPPHCPACIEPGAELCEICRRQFVCVPRSGCVRCGAPVAPNGRCLASHRPLQGLRQLVAPYRFVGTAGRLVRRFKLDADASAGHWLRRAMADAWRQCGRTVRPVVVAVPLHRLASPSAAVSIRRCWLAAGHRDAAEASFGTAERWFGRARRRRREVLGSARVPRTYAGAFVGPSSGAESATAMCCWWTTCSPVGRPLAHAQSG